MTEEISIVERLSIIINRVKARAEQQPLIYYPIYYILLPIKYILYILKWQLYKHTARFTKDWRNTTEQRPRKIIASLTSYPARINLVPYAIASIMHQTVKPDKIILWLGKDSFPDEKLPPVFDKLRACGVDIELREDIGPHTKYFYAMQEYPEDLIITFDDDRVNPDYIIEKLYRSYLKHPECVSAMRMVKIVFTPEGNIADYNDFDFEHNAPEGVETFAYLPEGICGVLYPPRCLHKETFNIDALKKLSPKQDDIWLFVMEILNGTRAVSARNEMTWIGYDIPGSQATALWPENITAGNDRYMKAVVDAYNYWPSDGRTLLEIIREG